MNLLRKLWNNLHLFMALPAILLFGLFFIYPLAQGIGISLTDSNGMAPPRFIGLQNFVDFFHDARAKKDVYNTVFFAIGSAPLLNVFGFLYALILDRPFKGKGFVRAVVYLPAVISPLIMGYVWYFILQPDRGFLYHLLASLHLGTGGSDWLGNANSALIVLVFINVWQFVGMTMIIYLAGLQSIPKELYEAGEIDGAGYLKSLWYITIPMVVQSIKINVVTNIIGSLSVFEVIVALTDGGPGYSTESLSIYILRMLYGSFTGYSTAVAMILFVMIIIPVFLFMRYINKKEFEM
ncbi:carbohydrate ABC transporter permease [Paenibacillus durus]|uniref:Sugar ABC transporter permease n=1 Tax=Paenibacillus durus ATCC 35681 TaxID=1333534 RepID=A0A0F7F8C8_PAEDU|nr:sugar ABC transporter permease [Paenibacillus durus]AKG34462.1 sugar ABC transporter permease [Paenibacillus durus ATCC 35681]